jgi:hypothetical protein
VLQYQPINIINFQNASRYYEFLMHQICVKMKLKDKTVCLTCKGIMLASHCDGNFKLYCLLSALEYFRQYFKLLVVINKYYFLMLENSKSWTRLELWLEVADTALLTRQLTCITKQHFDTLISFISWSPRKGMSFFLWRCYVSILGLG